MKFYHAAPRPARAGCSSFPLRGNCGLALPVADKARPQFPQPRHKVNCRAAAREGTLGCWRAIAKQAREWQLRQGGQWPKADREEPRRTSDARPNGVGCLSSACRVSSPERGGVTGACDGDGGVKPLRHSGSPPRQLPLQGSTYASLPAGRRRILSKAFAHLAILCYNRSRKQGEVRHDGR